MTRPLISKTSGAARAPYRTAYEVFHRAAGSRVLLIGDHASNVLPETYGSLGLPESSFARHIACDLGVAELVEGLSNALDAQAILAGFSRLLIDPNRGEDDPTLIMRLSDGEIIPGNARVDGPEAERRLDLYHRPYHRAIDLALDAMIAMGQAPVIVSMHSFTPSWRGRARPWHCGVLWSGDKPTGDFCIAHLRKEPGLNVGDNQPYTGALDGDSMDRHGTKRGIAHVLIEVRQDLIADERGCAEWVSRLAPIFAKLVTRPAQETC